MQLTISYKNGSQRIVNVIPQFTETDEIRQGYKTIFVTVEQKCEDIALNGGREPYTIVLREGTDIVYSTTNVANKPIAKEEPHQFIIRENVTEKELKDLKKKEFTKKWVAGSERLSWDRGVKLLFTDVNW